MSLPWLGTTWVQRGSDYRRRRALALVVMGLGSLLVWAMSGGFLYGVWSEVGPVARLVISGWVLVGLVWGLRFGWRVSAAIDPRAQRFPTLVITVNLPFCCGGLLAVLVAWSLPVVPAERTARAASFGHPWPPSRR